MINLKRCPLLIQSDTSPSLTTQGASWTRTYMSECLKEKCAAYNNGKCVRFDTNEEQAIEAWNSTQDDRERLAQLLVETAQFCNFGEKAAYLIDNGVTFREG